MRIFVLVFSFYFLCFSPAILAKKNIKPFLPKTFKADFEQIITSSISGKQKKSFGIIEYKFRGHLKLEVISPEDTKALFISNPSTTWYYTPPFLEGEKGELTTNPTSKTGHFRFFDILSHGLVSNKKYKIVRTSSGGVNLLLAAKDSKKMGIKEALLLFSKKKESFNNLERVELTKNNGSVVIIKLINIKKNIKFKKDNFVFDSKRYKI